MSSSPAINTAAYYQWCFITCERVAVVHRRPRLQHIACCSVNAGSQARYRLRIAISAYPTCIWRPRQESSRRNIAMPFGMEKLEWRGYPMVKKFWWYVYSLWHNWRTWQTDRQTPHDDIGRACIASRGNKMMHNIYLHSPVSLRQGSPVPRELLPPHIGRCQSSATSIF